MGIEEKILVNGCPCCSMFKELPEGTILHYPRDKKDILGSEFIIVECSECKKPLVIYGEHVMELSKEAYGRILYRCKLLFGGVTKIGNKHKVVQDHWMLHLIKDV